MFNEVDIILFILQALSNPQYYIATQGPKANTVKSFWEMVWIYCSPVIVMLCKCFEKNKVKVLSNLHLVGTKN